MRRQGPRSHLDRDPVVPVTSTHHTTQATWLGLGFRVRVRAWLRVRLRVGLRVGLGFRLRLRGRVRRRRSRILSPTWNTG
eukprot:scaffold79823_cov18-Phaeocystis_antarctica.AAC.1